MIKYSHSINFVKVLFVWELLLLTCMPLKEIKHFKLRRSRYIWLKYSKQRYKENLCLKMLKANINIHINQIMSLSIIFNSCPLL